MAIKEFKFKLKDVKTRKLSLLHDKDDNSLQVLVDGKVADKDEKGTRYVIEDDKGNEIKFESGLDEKWNPWLKANQEDVKLALPLAWYQWVWIGLPVILIFTGGLIGGMIGGAATYLNMVIMQSSRSAATRYGITLILSVSAAFLYIVLALLLNIALGTKQGSFFTDAFKQGVSQVSESIKPEPSKPDNIPNVYVDNGSGSVLEFSVDGKVQGELKPYSYKSLNFKTGKHKFVFTEDRKEYDTVEADLEKNKACIINPKGLSSYVVATASYSSFNIVAGGGTGYETVKDKKCLSADYGLAEGLPQKIEVKMKTKDMGQVLCRTKLMKSLPENLGSQQAYSILKDEAGSLAVFCYDDKERFMISLLSALGGEPRKPEHRDMLLDYASKSEKYVLNAALKALDAYGEQIPADKLVEFVMADEKVSFSGMPYDSPAIDGRSGWAMKLLLKRGKADVIIGDFAKLQPYKKGLLLKYLLTDGHGQLKKSLADSVLAAETIQDEFMLCSLLGILAAKDFTPDEGQMEKIDAYISRIEMDRVKKHGETTWDAKINDMAAAGTKNQYIQNKLKESIKKGGNDSKVAVTLVKNGDYKTVLEIFGNFKGYEKLDVLRNLPMAKDGKIPEEAFGIAWLIVDEKDDNLWRYGMQYLAGNYPPGMEFFRKAWAYSSKIEDEKRKTSFNRELLSCSYSRLNEMSLQDLCAVAAEAPTENFVKQVVEKIEREDGKRAENFTGLAKAYPTAGDANRTLIMKQMNNITHLQYVFRKPEEFNAISGFLKLGLSDKTQSAREAALEAAFKMGNAEFPAEDTALKIISGADNDSKKVLQNRFDWWIVEIWRIKTNDRNSRTKALAKIAAVLERTEDKDNAKFANNSLENPDEAETQYVEALIRIADKSKLPDARHDCLRRLGSLDLDKNPAALAQMIKSLDDTDLNVKYQAFTTLSHRIRDDKEGKILARLKATAAKEADPKTKADMERSLKSYLPPDQPPKQKPPAKR